MFKWIAASINTYLAQYKAMRGHSRLLCSQTVILNVNYGFEIHNQNLPKLFAFHTFVHTIVLTRHQCLLAHAGALAAN